MARAPRAQRRRADEDGFDLADPAGATSKTGSEKRLRGTADEAHGPEHVLKLHPSKADK